MSADHASPLLPTDEFSVRLRRLRANQNTLGSSSTIHTADDYGNAATWVVETCREEGGDEWIFLQRNDAAGGTRHVLPPAVTVALARHRDALIVRARRRHGHNIMALRKERGDKLGNPEALRKARRAKKGGAK